MTGADLFRTFGLVATKARSGGRGGSDSGGRVISRFGHIGDRTFERVQFGAGDCIDQRLAPSLGATAPAGIPSDIAVLPSA